MKLKHNHLVALTVTSLVLGVSTVGMTHAQVLTSMRTLRSPSTVVETSRKNPMIDGVAARLGVRLQNTYGTEVPLSSLRRAVLERQRLLSHTVHVHLPVSGAATMTGELLWDVTLQEHSGWLQANITTADINFAVNPEHIADSLATHMPLGLQKVSDASVMNTQTDTYGVNRVTLTGRPKSGYEFVSEDTAFRLAAALRLRTDSITLPLRYRDGTILSNGSGGLVALELLSTGRSDYQTSPWGRKMNIKKGTEEHLHNVRIPQGSTFSFNKVLGGPVTLSRGWFDSLIIVNGSELEPAPGGGICQVATTAYRAALLAGLDVTKRAPHSLYVHYYKLFGLGLDATIFPGKQDMAFVNDTPGDIIVQARTQGSEVFVEFYGVKDGRHVDLAGPYFMQNAEGSGLPRALRSNEIGWMQTITNADGSSDERPIISAYGKMPRSLATEVLAAAPDSVATLHAAADMQADILR